MSRAYLHSTMFLLILSSCFVNFPSGGDLHSTMFLLIRCTFYEHCPECFNLHSTMFLLIQRRSCACIRRSPLFTFHNVSINTLLHLSSHRSTCKFTFHNVSINTGSVHRYVYAEYEFTFHNVSINTRQRSTVPPVGTIYIPQCFY